MSRQSYVTTRPCAQCGEQFTTTRLREVEQKVCSRACRSIWEGVNGRPASRVDAISFDCRQCGNKFEMKPSYVTAYRKKWSKDPMYCSMPCSDLGRKRDAESRASENLTCIQCGGPVDPRKPSGFLRRGRCLCSTECRALFRRLSYQRKNAEITPEPRVAKNGYLRLIVPGANGAPSRDVLQHRYVMEQSIGRQLLPEETVHHKDGNRANNDISNLELFSSRHGPGQRVADKVAFAVEIIRLYPEYARQLDVMLVDLEQITSGSA